MMKIKEESKNLPDKEKVIELESQVILKESFRVQDLERELEKVNSQLESLANRKIWLTEKINQVNSVIKGN